MFYGTLNLYFYEGYDCFDLDLPLMVNSYSKYIVNPITWFLKSSLKTKEETLQKELERCIKNVEIPLDKIENSNNFIIQFNTDLYIDDTIPTKLGGCRVTGATVHASTSSSKKINLLFKQQLVKQVLETIKEVKK